MIRPAKSAQMTTPLLLQQPTSQRINGVLVKTYTDAPGVIMANFASYGGTERDVNGMLSIEDTATVTTWFRPDIQAGCRVVRLADGKDEAGKYRAVYEIMGDPENIDMRNVFLVFKVRRVKGGA